MSDKPEQHSQQRIEIELDSVDDCIRAVCVYRGSHLEKQLTRSREGAGMSLLNIAKDHPDALICWFDYRAVEHLTPRATWGRLLRHPLEIRFYPGPADDRWRLASIGFAAHYSAFLMPMQEQQVAPVILISPVAGVCQARVLTSFEDPQQKLSLLRVLADIGRTLMFSGGCSYADARLFHLSANVDEVRSNTEVSWRDVADLVASQCSRRSLLPWLLGLLIFHGRLPLFAAIRALQAPYELSADKQQLMNVYDDLPQPEPIEQIEVVIPTLERPTYLLRILHDLAGQDYLPVRVHIIAQGIDSVPPEVIDIEWPFEVAIQQVPWVGVCRARNLGIDAVKEKWVALVDDDLRLPANYLRKMLTLAIRFRVEAVNALPKETQILGTSPDLLVWTWRHFLSGFALCTRKILLAAGGFQERMEGIIFEDYELGVRIRHAGSHIMVTREIAVLCEGAPVGGFRSDKISQRGPKQHPNFAIYFSLAPFMTKAMRVGFHMQYLRAVLTSKRWWRWPGEIIVLIIEYKKAHRLYEN